MANKHKWESHARIDIVGIHNKYSRTDTKNCKSYNLSKEYDQRVTILQHGYNMVEQSQPFERVRPKGHNSLTML